jgi:hypothetical protein
MYDNNTLQYYMQLCTVVASSRWLLLHRKCAAMRLERVWQAADSDYALLLHCISIGPLVSSHLLPFADTTTTATTCYHRTATVAQYVHCRAASAQCQWQRRLGER